MCTDDTDRGERWVSETELSSKGSARGCVLGHNWLQYSTDNVWKPRRKTLSCLLSVARAAEQEENTTPGQKTLLCLLNHGIKH